MSIYGYLQAALHGCYRQRQAGRSTLRGRHGHPGHPCLQVTSGQIRQSRWSVGLKEPPS